MRTMIAAAFGAGLLLATACGAQETGNPTAEQWNGPAAQAFVARARTLAGEDPDLKFDMAFNCTPEGTHAGGSIGPATGGAGGDIAAVADSGSLPRLAFVPGGRPARDMPAQHVFDNLWWFGDTGVGAWLVTSPDGYLLFDASNDAGDAQRLILDQMRAVGLDPGKIKYLVFGHFHLDHTGGGHLIQSLYHPRTYMGRDDWPLYFASLSGTGGQASRIRDKVPMVRGEDLRDGMTLTVGDTTTTFYAMPGHTPGATGMILKVRYQGRSHPVLIVTASAGGNNVRNRETLIGGYEHIWDAGLREKVEAVLQSHPNYNQNTLSRMAYVTGHYPPATNPMLYGAEKTRRYIEITRACAQARLAALGW